GSGRRWCGDVRGAGGCAGRGPRCWPETGRRCRTRPVGLSCGLSSDLCCPRSNHVCRLVSSHVLSRSGRGHVRGRPAPAPARGPSAAAQRQLRAANSACTVPSDDSTSAVPASTAFARVANDWYAEAPGATPVTVRSPNGVRSVTSTGTVPVFLAVTATYALLPRQRGAACAVIVDGAASGATSTAISAAVVHGFPSTSRSATSLT